MTDEKICTKCRFKDSMGHCAKTLNDVIDERLDKKGQCGEKGLLWEELQDSDFLQLLN